MEGFKLAMRVFKVATEDFELAMRVFKLVTRVFKRAIEVFTVRSEASTLAREDFKAPESPGKTPESIRKALGPTRKPLGDWRNGPRAAQKPIASKLERRGLKRKGAGRPRRRDRERRKTAFQEALFLVRRFTAGTSSSRSTWRSASMVTGADSGATAARRAALISVW